MNYELMHYFEENVDLFFLVMLLIVLGIYTTSLCICMCCFDCDRRNCHRNCHRRNCNCRNCFEREVSDFTNVQTHHQHLFTKYYNNEKGYVFKITHIEV